MQTLVDIPEEQVSRLDVLSQECNIPRDSLVQMAIRKYLESRENGIAESFGAWAGAQGDGLDYQQRIRSEW